MAITINGSGTVTGISAGGLPDGVITTDDLASSVPVAKAWVNFNGTGTPAIRASYNVSSITDNGTGDYTVNFTSALADANYCSATCSDGSNISQLGSVATETKSTSSIRLFCAVVVGVPGTSAATLFDLENVNVAIFR